jgi:hypothetical protein
MLTHLRYKTIDHPGLLGAFIASWILHCILYAIAATTTIFYPPTADREFISVDLFFASPGSGSQDAELRKIQQNPYQPSAEYDAIENGKAEAPIPVMTPQNQVINDLELLTVHSPQPEIKKVSHVRIPPTPVIPQRVKEVSKLPPSTPVIIPVVEKTPEAGLEKSVKPVSVEVTPPSAITVQSKSVEQSEQDKLAIENEKIRRQLEAEQKAAQERAHEAARVAELEKYEAAKAARLRAENERIRRDQQEAEQKAAKDRAQEEARAAKAARAAELEKLESERVAKVRAATERARIEREAADKKRREQLARVKREEENAAKEKLERERAAIERATKDKMDKVRMAATVRNNENALSAKPAGNAMPAGPARAANTAVAVAAAPGKPLTTTSAPNAEKNQTEHKGLALPPVAGDIKLLITSEEDLLVKVLFINHPKARHDKPISKKDAKEQQKITPVVVRTAKSTLEAVIERSREGIYIFVVEQKGNKPVNGKFSLKLFESRSKSVASREISSQTEIARLLMPEGILWEEDAAFSGNIEDSDSVTKFNSDSGLVWKEYRR